MQKPSFWAAFEEKGDDHGFDSVAKTQTCAREQTDQHGANAPSRTITKTATREEDDQDVGPRGFAAFPRATQTETQTLTKTREESDQDPVRSGLASLPRITTMNTQTMTEVKREEPDQDALGHQFASIPRSDGVHA